MRSLHRYRALGLAAATSLLVACANDDPAGPSNPPTRFGVAGDFQVVVVRADAPAAAQGALVNNLADAVARVRAGGTIKVHPGTYAVADVRISKPLTIEGVGSDLPVIEAGSAFSSFSIRDAAEGMVRLRRLRFRNAAWNPVFITGRYDQIVIEDSEFYPVNGPKTNGSLGYSGGILVIQARGNSAVIRNNSFTGGDIGVHANDAAGVVIRGNRFSNQDNAAIHGGMGGDIHAEGNTIEGCGPNWCVGLFDGSMGWAGSAKFVRNTITVDISRPTVNVLQLHRGNYEIVGNTITGVGGVRNPTDATTWPVRSNIIAVQGTATLTGNTISGGFNGLGLGFVAASGTDNRVSDVGSPLNIQEATVSIHRSDFTNYARAIQFVHAPGASSITCNWWGSATGPQNMDVAVPATLYTPWATAPVAGTETSSCTGASS